MTPTAGYVGYRLLRRCQIHRLLDAERISVDEVRRLKAQGERLIIIDVRSRVQCKLDPRRIAGAYAMEAGEIANFGTGLSRHDPVVLYCACPDEATAAWVTRTLMRRGFTEVHPLAGGLDAWQAAGLGIEHQS